MFTVLVAADVYGTKGNFEVTFPSKPTLAELTRQTEAIYGVEAAARRPVGTLAAPFMVSRFQLYNDRLQQWVDLTSASALTDRCQVFAFQTQPAAAAVPPSTTAAAAAAVAATVSPATAPAAAAAAAAAANSAAAATATASAARAASAHAALEMARANALAVPGAVPTLPDNATHDDKTRSVFEELDTNRNRVLEIDELRYGFELLHIDFSGNTIADLVAKADSDQDGVVSFPEWQRFAQRFPTLIDSFYFRIKAHWENVRRQQEIRASKELLAELKERSQQAQVAWLEAQRDSDAARSRLSAQEAALAQATDAQRAAEQAHLEGRRDVERATADLNARERELAAQREREAQSATLHADCVRDTEAAQQRLAVAQAQTMAAQENERQAAAVLAEAQAEVERQRQLTAQRSAEVTDARSREQAAALAATEAVRDATLAGERLARADLDVAAKQQREKELEAAHHQAQLETQRSTARRDEETRALQIQREQEEGAHAARLEAQRLSEEADRKVVALEAENQAFAQKRRTVEEQEAPLLEQEIRLRAQRDALEENEAKLRGDHQQFCVATRSTSPGPAATVAPVAHPLTLASSSLPVATASAAAAAANASAANAAAATATAAALRSSSPRRDYLKYSSVPPASSTYLGRGLSPRLDYPRAPLTSAATPASPSYLDTPSKPRNL